MLAPPVKLRTQTLEEFNLSRWEINVLIQGLALICERKIYGKEPERVQNILSLASRFKRSIPND